MDHLKIETNCCVILYNEGKIEFAQSYCLAIAQNYWRTILRKTGVSWHIRAYKGAQIPLTTELKAMALAKAQSLSQLEPEHAGYELSIKYMNLLPKGYRGKHGIYYTPIDIVTTMLDEAKRNGINFKTARIIDTSSGGSAFLAPVCRVMKRDDLCDQGIVEDIESRLTGFELDPFAAWLSQFLIDCELAFLAPTAQRPKQIVHNSDALNMSSKFFGGYDYVIGNPPYGKMKLKEVPKKRYGDILSGAPNLYQLFFKLSFLLVRDNGFVHIITPTGFISGLYFKALRTYINNQVSSISFSFFKHRKDIFTGVQQELVISLFKKLVKPHRTVINSITYNRKKNLSVSRVGTISLQKKDPWILPKTREELKAAKISLLCRHSLSSIGYFVSTGYVVPHRSSKHLSNRKVKVARPMIWSEAIQNDGFKPEVAYSKGRLKWYRPASMAGLIKEPVILIKRTSAKEQRRRIHAALVDQSYIDKHDGFFAENHVNVLKATNNQIVDLADILRLLKSRIVDQLFRCTSGTVTVSSTELNQLAMPSPEALQEFANKTRDSVDPEQIEKAACVAYMVK